MSDFTRGGNTALTRAAQALDGAGYPPELTSWLNDCAHIVDDGTVGRNKRQPGFSAPWPPPPKSVKATARDEDDVFSPQALAALPEIMDFLSAQATLMRRKTGRDALNIANDVLRQAITGEI